MHCECSNRVRILKQSDDGGGGYSHGTVRNVGVIQDGVAAWLSLTEWSIWKRSGDYNRHLLFISMRTEVTAVSGMSATESSGLDELRL